MADLRTIEALLATDLVTEPTRRAMQHRLRTPRKPAPEYFSPQAFLQLEAICARLIPQDHAEVDLPGELDTALHSGSGKGWRYDKLPEDRLLFEAGTLAIEAEARALHNVSFDMLEPQQQDNLLRLVQHGAVSAPHWEPIHPVMFFSELLTALVTIYYSHPAGRAQSGDLSFADARGWGDLGPGASGDLPD